MATVVAMEKWKAPALAETGIDGNDSGHGSDDDVKVIKSDGFAKQPGRLQGTKATKGGFALLQK